MSKYCDNFDILLTLITRVIMEFPASNNNLLSLTCCNDQSERCKTGVCEDCLKELNIYI